MRIITLLIILLSISCTKEHELKSKKDGRLFAVVDTSALYDSTLIAQYPFLNGSNDFLKIGYVNKWVNRKLILKKIYAEEFQNNQNILLQLKKIEEDFLISKFIKNRADENKISKAHLEEYYADNITDFLIPENEYKYQLIYFDRKDEATTVFNYMKKSMKFNFNSLKDEYSKVIVQKEVIGNFTKESKIVSKTVSNKLSELKIGGFSKPFKENNNYIIVKLVDKRVEGDAFPFIEVEGKIMLREYAKYETKIYHEIADSLKLYSSVKVYINGDVND